MERCNPIPIQTPPSEHELLRYSERGRTHGMKDVVTLERYHIVVWMKVIFTDGAFSVSERGCTVRKKERSTLNQNQDKNEHTDIIC